ncbi:MAG: MerR family transcriptional regulator [Lachnospiraceae bacterium]|nr:MerR family transcriptional regulator [Lachnospiraceae bacterium]
MFTAINKVSMDMGISSRTLRYWEAAGLLTSVRDAGSGWRLYDEEALQCIRIIDLLRRLDLSTREIKIIIDSRSADSLCHILQKRLTKIEKTRSDLETLKAVIAEIIVVVKADSSLTLSSLENILLPITLERKKHIAAKLKGGFRVKSVKDKYDDVQIVKMAPSRAVAYSCVDTEPEDKAFSPVKEWIEKNKLEGTMRIFGFNTEPYPSGNNPYGFGFCATIPEGINIPEPLYEMKIPGGLYAVIPGNTYEGDPSFGWKKVHDLCHDNEWEWKYDESRIGLEEHIERADGKSEFIISILFPIKKK